MVTAYVLVTAKSGMEREIFAQLEDIKQVKKVYEIFGEWDLIAEVVVKELPELDVIISEKIRVIPEVEMTSTLIAVE
ncbi:Lrp/AsnC ligand binding domain-containing protein [Candidatus Woesearchaeota archaeon]|nr:MAG: regulatory protein AsnC [archaeon GW2011_AR4]MBS3130534.1 Lrp/AsnC ligand binding domain-containing protein [Candidatus Woesearchaeota archaeon]HIH38014.1 Lrp/AsnC family transcriptional regulator [Candidatus Woesearchaeota archaeon]HIH48683.1 Lrp/AsnC family transcriptional regulator [Candidatus Woesearchaeota archaeon]HIJ02983.1 Lrp/AsnC family transcriptional regulator [Candidatus Woesearchaeota archaeon]